MYEGTLCCSCLVEYLRSISLPVPVVVEDTSSSSEYGSVSPDNELCTNPFNFKPSTKCYSEREVKGHRSLFLRSAEVNSSLHMPYYVTIYSAFSVSAFSKSVNLLQYSCGELWGPQCTTFSRRERLWFLHAEERQWKESDSSPNPDWGQRENSASPARGADTGEPEHSVVCLVTFIRLCDWQ